MTNKTLRDTFWDRVYDLAKVDKDVVLVSADMGAPALDKFRTDLSSQFVNVGIAEQNAILVSAGLAKEGKKVFVYAIAPFITLRVYEQIRLALAAMDIPVTVVGVGSGMSYDDSGPTHHTVEDISILRILPHFYINNLTDAVMAEKFADLSVTMKHPNYIRLDRKPCENIYSKDEDFTKGLATLRKGNDITIVATGNMVHNGLIVVDQLKEKGINAGLIDVYTLPINEKLFLEELGNASQLMTLEEHTLPGGFGSAVCEVLADNNKLIPVTRVGMDLTDGYCYKYGGRDHLQSLYGLAPYQLTEKIVNLLK